MGRYCFLSHKIVRTKQSLINNEKKNFKTKSNSLHNREFDIQIFFFFTKTHTSVIYVRYAVNIVYIYRKRKQNKKKNSLNFHLV